MSGISEEDFFQNVFLYILENSYGCLCEEVEDFKTDAENMKQSDYKEYEFKLLKYVTQQRKLAKIARYKSFDYFIENEGRSLVKEVNEILLRFSKHSELLRVQSLFENAMNRFYHNSNCGLFSFIKPYITREAFAILIDFTKTEIQETSTETKELIRIVNLDISDILKGIL